MFRRKTSRSMPTMPPARRPHPDPRKEAELQRIISLRLAIARDEQMASEAAAAASKADRQAGRVSYHGNQDCAAYAERAKELRATVDRARDEIATMHDEIAKRIAALGDEDLLWLDLQ